LKKVVPYLLLALLIEVASCGSKSELPSLKETYSLNDKEPFGTYVLHQQLNQLFYHNNFYVAKKSMQKSFSGNYDTASLYVNVSKNFFLTADERNSMLNFVSNGNSMFIASENIDSNFLKTIGFEQTTTRSLLLDDLIFSMHYTSVKMQTGIFEDTTAFSYYYLPFSNYFSNYPEASAKVLGRNESGAANFIVLFYGKGRFYLHCDPRAFSNYFLLQKENYKYIQYAFSFAPAIPEHIYWDDYYNKRNYPPDETGDRSWLGVLMQYPAMAWAFYLVLSMLALFVLFDSKRRQRIIKPLQPNVNTSVAFTETVGRLYLQKRDNRNIADKMITYFLEHIRNQYFLNTTHLNEEFIDTLSRKSNVPVQQTSKLFHTINEVQQSAEINDQQLLLLNQQIEIFYKQKT
jgi:hypothetical protein